MRSAWARSRLAGFTLFEALFATFLMVIILAALATVTAQWLPNWDRGLARMQRVEVLAMGLSRLTSDLAAAEFVSSGGPNDPPLFDGTEQAVTFVRTAIGPNAFAGLEVIRIAEMTDSRGSALVRMAAPFVLGGGALNYSAPVVILRAPYHVVFSYAGPDRIWRASWGGTASLPRAIRIRTVDARKVMSTSTYVAAEMPAPCVTMRNSAECASILRPSASDTTATWRSFIDSSRAQ